MKYTSKLKPCHFREQTELNKNSSPEWNSDFYQVINLYIDFSFLV